MKTLLLYDEEGTELKWKIVEKDIKHLHLCYINSDITDEQTQEINELIFSKEWSLLPDLQVITTDPFPSHDAVVLVGFAG